jgi:predicted phage terminase large subunit-like protein
MTAPKKALPPAAAIDREIGLRGSFYDFVKMVWPLVEHGRVFVDNWHIEAICQHLEAVFRGEIKRLVINVPPGSMKSLLTSVMWPVWCWVQDPGWRFILGSFDESLVGRRDGGKVIDIVKSKWFHERWGDRVMIKGKDPSISEFYTTKGGMRFATSVGGKVLGRHAHAFIVDDPTKPQTMTDATLADARKWKQETTSSRLLPGGAYVLIMQRLHSNDLAGMAEEENETEGGAKYDLLRLPMRYEAEVACSTSIGFVDPRKEEGELLWPAYKDEGEVAQQEKDMGGKDSATVAAQLQQRPAPAKGLIFQKDWWRYYTELPARFDLVIDSWDCAFKDTDGSDFVAGQRWGMLGSSFYLFPFRVKKRLSFTKTCAAVKAMRVKTDANGKLYPTPMGILVEDKANGAAVMNSLQLEVPGLIAIDPDGGKVARANAITPLYEAGNVFHPDKSIAPWIEDHEASLLKFPKGKNDDDVDAETQALNYLRTKASRFAAAMDQLAKDGVANKVPTWLL